VKINYRSEIDGLRAIAVAGVILYHAKITIWGYKFFQGGFIGVDIFFVLSGYLIASIILKELITTSSFSFKHFYERRIRRILPALLFVMLVSLSFAWIYLLPSSLIDFSKSILYSLGFSSNFYFYYSGQIYGAESSLLKPFLHTWSLSVEEQFYIFFPISLLFLFKYFRKYIGIILIIGFLISLVMADWGSRNHPSFNFYTLPTRGWELLVGSILAYFEIRLGHRSKNHTLNLILPSIGLILIGHSFLFFNNQMSLPSFYTLSPIIGVCLIIWFSDKDELITKILSLKLLVGIGLISYSLYLWHYPIFAFARISDFSKGDIFQNLFLGVIILFLSIISYYFIERPARNKSYSFKTVLFLILLVISLLIAINITVVKNYGFKNRLKFPEFYQEKFTYNYLTQNSKICFESTEVCKFNTGKKKKIILIGDSQFASISYNLKQRINNYQFIPITSAWLFYFESDNIILINSKTKKIHPTFDELNFKIRKELKNSKNNIIIFGGSTSEYFFKKKNVDRRDNLSFEYVDKSGLEYSSQLLKTNFINQLKKLTKHNIVVLIYPIPTMGKKNLLKNIKNLEKHTYKYEDYIKINNEVIKYFNSINLDNLIKIRPADVLCEKTLNECPLYDEVKKKYFYSDGSHTSLYGSEIINNLIIKEIKKIELKSN